jgi:hypothetical protein
MTASIFAPVGRGACPRSARYWMLSKCAGSSATFQTGKIPIQAQLLTSTTTTSARRSHT